MQRLQVELTLIEVLALSEFLERDFGITRNLTQYPITTALMKIQNALEGWEDDANN